MKRPDIRLHPARHKRVAMGHPWVFSNEVVMDAAAKALPAGSIVTFRAHDGSVLGWGGFNPHHLIAGRIFDRTPLGGPDADWFAARFQRALDLRQRLLDVPYYRLVHGESDGLPGVICDRFGDVLSLHINTAAMQNLLPVLLEALDRVLAPAAVLVRGSKGAVEAEGMADRADPVKGSIPQRLPVMENGITYFADLLGGQKTGWYFDQRDNHALIASMARGKSVLDLFCHAGGFGLAAAARGAARVVGVDSSALALELAAAGADANGLSALCTWHKADVFDDLAARAAGAERFDIVIADPPPFVKSRKDIAAGARGYRKLTKMAASVVARDGLLYVASCSHNMTLDLLGAEVARGLTEAGRTGRILHTSFAAPDHPVHPHLPESAYLKGFVVAVD